MFETAISDGADQLWLEQEVSEAGRVGASVATLGLITNSGSGCSLLRSAIGRWSLSGLELIVGVINEILFGRHGEWRCVGL